MPEWIIPVLLLTSLCIAIATFIIVYYNRPIETFTSASSGTTGSSDMAGQTLTTPLPTNKKDLIADVLNIVRPEITRLQALKSSDAVIHARIQNLITIRNTLQQMYVDLLEGHITDKDVDFGPEEVAAFLPAIGPNSDISQPLPQLFAPLETTLSALSDSSIYWRMELGIQNYNPKPAITVTGVGDLSSAIDATVTDQSDDTRGGNALSVSNSFTSSHTQPWGGNGSSATNNSSLARLSSTDDVGAEAVGAMDYKTRLKDTCDAIRAGNLGDPSDFGCLAKNAEVSPTFDYKGRYLTVCERLGYTWGSGYQQMLGCPAAVN